jgi:hypothetical protein
LVSGIDIVSISATDSDPVDLFPPAHGTEPCHAAVCCAAGAAHAGTVEASAVAELPVRNDRRARVSMVNNMFDLVAKTEGFGPAGGARVGFC